MLVRTADRAPVEPAQQRWYQDIRERSIERLERVATSQRSRRVIRGSVVAVVALTALTGWVLRPTPAASTPESSIEQFYDDLDFQRFDDAWKRLDPATRPSFDQYLLERSVVDGLVSSYAKLDRVEPRLIEQADGRAKVEVSLVYITSLAEYRVSASHDLRLIGDEWKIAAEQSDVSTTPDQFARATEVDYLSQGRRQVTTEVTLFGDVLDRPRVQTISATAIEAEGRFTVVGEITNLDVDPADLTITARFLDDGGEILVEHNASIITIHKVLPRETVPFRIDLEAIAGSDETTTDASGSFHPDLFASPNIDVEQIASIELATKAVVTGRDLQRSLQTQNMSIETDDEGNLWLVGEIRNDGTQTATVPHLLITLLNDDGTVGWVDHAWVDQAVRPQRTVSFSVPLTSGDGLTPLGTPLQIFGNGITRAEGPPFVASAELTLPAASDFRGIRVSVHSFYRTPPS